MHVIYNNLSEDFHQANSKEHYKLLVSAMINEKSLKQSQQNGNQDQNLE